MRTTADTKTGGAKRSSFRVLAADQILLVSTLRAASPVVAAIPGTLESRECQRGKMSRMLKGRMLIIGRVGEDHPRSAQ